MIYLASSWRNPHYNHVLSELRLWGYDVYDFREEGSAFDWSDVDPKWVNSPGVRIEYPPEKLIEMLYHPKANYGFAQDFSNLDKCDTLVLVTPCGKSAHLELGYAIGQKKRTAILMMEPSEPELMYRMADKIISHGTYLMEWLHG